MNRLQRSMIAQARKRFGKILPCSGKSSLEDCFMDMGEYGYFLYFNSPDGSTHVVKADRKREMIEAVCAAK